MLSTPNIYRIVVAATQSNKVMLIVMAIVIVTIIVDVSLAKVYDLITKQPLSIWRFTAFAAIASICIVSQYFILGYLNQKSVQIKGVTKLHIRVTQGIARATQYMLTAVLLFLISQVILTLHYYTLLVMMVVWISYGFAIIMLGLLALRFFAWSFSNRNLVVILYGLASISLSINLISTLIYVNDILVDRPNVTMPYSAGSMVSIPPHSATAMLNSGFFISSVISYALLWVATAALLHHHTRKLGRLRYWVIIAAPLVLFSSQFASFFAHLFDPLIGSSDPVMFTLWITLIFTLSKPVGGILFGIAFFTIAKNFRHDVTLRNYLIISAFGFVLLFVSNQASVLIVTPFPPYGIMTVSFVGLASYLMLLGIYSSAISISEDVKLRQMVRRTALDQSRLLDSMGTAYMKQEIQKKVVKIMRDNSEKLIEATGIDSLPSEDELKRYVDEVLKEVSMQEKRRSRS